MIYYNYKNERDIIIEALNDWETLGVVADSLLGWFSTDEIVNWFVDGYCCRDYTEVAKILVDDKDYNQIIDYYERHCL